MEHLREFDFFKKSAPTPEPNKLKQWISLNYNKIQDIFYKIGEGLNVSGAEVFTDSLFTVSYDPPNEEMPTTISYLLNDINQRIGIIIGDMNITWRFGVDDPFMIRFILSKPFK